MNFELIQAKVDKDRVPTLWDASAQAAEREALATEAMGWQQLESGVYLHQGSDEWVVDIVGQAHCGMQDSNVVWVLG
jgi:hypothetical protein